MTTFLLLISLLLNGVAIYSIIILYMRQNRLVEVEKKQEQVMKDMEEDFSAYLLEMKEENEAFIQRFQQIRDQDKPSGDKKDNNLQSVQVRSKTSTNKINSKADESAASWSEQAGKALKKQAVKAYQNTVAAAEHNASTPEEVSDILGDAPEIEESLQHAAENESSPMTQDEIYRDLFVNQVFLLQKQGLSSDEIAKKLGKGKTEIELLLKFV